jgi:hypothetical protein
VISARTSLRTGCCGGRGCSEYTERVQWRLTPGVWQNAAVLSIEIRWKELIPALKGIYPITLNEGTKNHSSNRKSLLSLWRVEKMLKYFLL